MTARSTRNPFATTLALAAAIAVLLLGAVTALKASSAVAGQPPAYLALGDSVSVGVGASDPATTGFVPLFRQTVGSELTPGLAPVAPGAQETASYLRLSNIAVSGETSTTFIANGQLNAALAALTERNQNPSEVDDVQVITLSIGGNDLTPLFATCPEVPIFVCLHWTGIALTAFDENLDLILVQLRAAAGPDTRIVVMTYYNSLQNPDCPLSDLAGLAQLIVNGLNLTIVNVAAAVPGTEVADVAGAGIVGTDLQPDCLHPNDAGHQKIANAFADTLTGS